MLLFCVEKTTNDISILLITRNISENIWNSGKDVKMNYKLRNFPNPIYAPLLLSQPLNHFQNITHYVIWCFYYKFLWAKGKEKV